MLSFLGEDLSFAICSHPRRSILCDQKEEKGGDQGERGGPPFTQRTLDMT